MENIKDWNDVFFLYSRHIGWADKVHLVTKHTSFLTCHNVSY